MYQVFGMNSPGTPITNPLPTPPTPNPVTTAPHLNIPPSLNSRHPPPIITLPPPVMMCDRHAWYVHLVYGLVCMCVRYGMYNKYGMNGVYGLYGMYGMYSMYGR